MAVTVPRRHTFMWTHAQRAAISFSNKNTQYFLFARTDLVCIRSSREGPAAIHTHSHEPPWYLTAPLYERTPAKTLFFCHQAVIESPPVLQTLQNFSSPSYKSCGSKNTKNTTRNTTEILPTSASDTTVHNDIAITYVKPRMTFPSCGSTFAAMSELDNYFCDTPPFRLSP